MIETPYLLFLGDAPDMLAAKVAIGIRDWRPDHAVGQIRLPGCGADLGLTEMTLAEAKAFTKGNILLASESVDSQMARLASSEFHFGRQLPMDEVVAQIDAVTVEEVRRVAEMAFSQKPAVAVLGPDPSEAKIRKVFGL